MTKQPDPTYDSSAFQACDDFDCGGWGYFLEGLTFPSKPVSKASPAEISEGLNRALNLAREAVQYSQDFLSGKDVAGQH